MKGLVHAVVVASHDSLGTHQIDRRRRGEEIARRPRGDHVSQRAEAESAARAADGQAAAIRRPPPDSGNYAEPHLLPFADANIHYVGQQIAVVVAETLEQATHAANLVRVTYDETPAKTDLLAASRRGDGQGIAAGAADSRWRRRRRIRRGRGEGRSDLSHAVRASQSDGGALARRRRGTATGSRCTTRRRTSSPCAPRWRRRSASRARTSRSCRRSSAARSAAKDRRGRTSSPAAFATYQVKRPVKLWLPRKQLFFTNGHRPATEQRVALGATSDGKLVSIIHEGVSQGNNVSDYNERFTRPTRDDLRLPEHSRGEQGRRAERRQRHVHARAGRERRACSRSSRRWTSWPRR